MSWIKTISYGDSKGSLRTAYRRVVGPGGHIDNIMELHSLRPHTLDGHMRLYKNVLHHSANSLPKWWLETIGTYVSLLNRCEYCVEHHYSGLRRLLVDDIRAFAIRNELERLVGIGADPEWEIPDKIFSPAETEALRYVYTLTIIPCQVTEGHIQALKSCGLSDGEILEINQVSAYFAYANRTVLGLGCTLEGDVLGLSPNDSADPENWAHG